MRNGNNRALSGVLTLGLAGIAGVAQAAPYTPAAPAAIHAAVSGIPLNFERNSGQAPEDVQYLAHGRAYAIALSERGAVLSLSPNAGEHAAAVIRLGLQGAARTPVPVAEAPLPGRVNYLIGSDRSKWLTNLRTYRRVRYSSVYPGVDLVYYGTEGRLEYDFDVAPHASARAIGLDFVGADALRLDPRGALQVKKGAHELIFEPPVAYQVIAGRRVPVAAAYRIDGSAVGFQLGAYDYSHSLIIDPVLSYFSYLGGSGTDVIGKTSPSGSSFNASGQAAALDSAGELYVTGYTTSTNFPTQASFAGPPAKTSGTTWAFVSKFAADGKSLVFSTYMGGTNDNDYGYGVALDGSGNAFVVGQAGSSDFPTTAGAFLRVCSPNYTNSPNNPHTGCGNNNGWESFVMKFSPTGALLASTFLGGTHTLSSADAVAVDAQGRPYIAGTAAPGEDIPPGNADNLTQAVGFQTTPGAVVRAYPYIAHVPINGGLQYDAYVSVFDPTLATLLYSTLIGDDRPQDGKMPFTSQADTHGTAVTVDSAGNFYVGGYSKDSYLPMTAGAFQSASTQCGPYSRPPTDTSIGGNCGVVAKFTPVGGANPPTLTYATYLGGEAPGASWRNEITGIAADTSGDAYVVGYANLAGFPTTTGAYQTTCNGYNGTNPGNIFCSAAFVSELNPTGSKLLASTYFGCATCSGDPVYTPGAIVLDPANNVYINGFGANSLPVVNGFASNNTTGGAAPFVAEFDPGLATLKFSTFVNVGNAGQIAPGGLALDSTGVIPAIYVVGNVNSPATSAATAGAFQQNYGGGTSDGFVAKIVMTEATKTTLSIAPTSATTGTSVTFTAMVAETTGTAVPTGTVTFSNGTTPLGSGTLNSSGIATFSTSSLAAGAYSVTAGYGGDTNNTASTSSAATLTITTPPPKPTATISVSPTSITQGASATITWSSTNATTCTASGAWSGSEATSGTQSVTPTAAGSLTYSLACAGTGGSANGSATLTVTAAPTGGGKGGGGALDPWTILALALAAWQLGLRARSAVNSVCRR